MPGRFSKLKNPCLDFLRLVSKAFLIVEALPTMVLLEEIEFEVDTDPPAIIRRERHAFRGQLILK